MQHSGICSIGHGLLMLFTYIRCVHMNLSCTLRGTTTAFDSMLTKGWNLAAGMCYLMNALRSAHNSSSDTI